MKQKKKNQIGNWLRFVVPDIEDYDGINGYLKIREGDSDGSV